MFYLLRVVACLYHSLSMQISSSFLLISPQFPLFLYPFLP
uniref:Uncharacterized protein n=1 Tax=Rhizophora mucronata TaxID=61149 RepID=A0A2P2N308_RHIMU